MVTLMRKRQIKKNNKKRWSAFQLKIARLDSKTIEFYRENPCIACEELLGIKLFDSQKYILQGAWNTPYALWCCSRNFGKTFIGAVFILLKAILYENQAIYIIAPQGHQSKETFKKIEDIVLREGMVAESNRGLTNIPQYETVRTPTNKTGFSHSPDSYKVKFYNGSEIFTLNSKPDSVRSRRATLVFFDEAAFCDEELISAAEAFAAQDSDLVMDVDDNFNPLTQPRKVPTQLIYASSMGETDHVFFSKYKTFYKKFLMGDQDYFICDFICEVAMETYVDGKVGKPLLTKKKVEEALTSDRDKALREYYNKPIRDGGNNQIVKWKQIYTNETFDLPKLKNENGGKYVILFDPARSRDNSILLIAEICFDDEIGYYAKLINCINMVDFSSKKKIKLDSNKQTDIIRETILNYNGKAPDYENIEHIYIDAGAGGGGVSTYADRLLEEWKDKDGNMHRGFIDSDYELYETLLNQYPDNSNKLTLIDPRKEKKIMVEKLIELMDLNLIKFPREYKRSGFVTLINTEKIKNEKDEFIDEEVMSEYHLSWDEEAALINLDELKKEVTSIQRIKNAENTVVSYVLPKEKENKMHDDRFYCLIMLAHHLTELRRENFKARDNGLYDVQCYAN